jgi:hypothetical protein
MSSKEKETIIGLISSTLILLIYSLYVYKNYLVSDWSLLNNFKFWGTAFLVMIPVSIVAQIVIHIIFAIIHKIATREDLDTSVSDERDKLIELRAIRISHVIFLIGFLLAMTTQAMGMEPFMLFVTLMASGFLATVGSGSAKIYYYRRGF